MKILLIANYLADSQESMQRFANMLHVGLASLGHDVRIMRPEAFFGGLKPSATGLGKWLGYIDKFILFPHKVHKAAHWADVVHICDHSNAFYTRHLENIPYVVTGHDLLAVRSALGEFPDNPTRWTGKKLQQIILQGLNRSQLMACDSQATRNDLLRISELRPEDIVVIYPGINGSYTPMEKKEAENRLNSLGLDFEDPFILHVGGNQWYKNRLGVLDIFENLIQLKEGFCFRLVMAGKPLTPKIRKFIEEHNLGPKVLELSAIEKEDLRALYSMSTALLFPSLQEGFGWPIIEAQACGCPVFTTNRPPMTEVGGDGAVYINPLRPQQAAHLIAKSLENRTKMKEAGFLNVKRFTTENMIKKYICLYEEACKRGR